MFRIRYAAEHGTMCGRAVGALERRMADNFLGKAKDRALALKDALVETVEQGFDTVTGKAVLQKVDGFAQEMEAVNTALATRIYELLDRQTKLEGELATAVAATNRNRKLIAISLILNLISVCAIVYLVVRGR
jgi:hypothetical protein